MRRMAQATAPLAMPAIIRLIISHMTAPNIPVITAGSHLPGHRRPGRSLVPRSGPGSGCRGESALATASVPRSTTHWAAASQLADRFPAVTVDPNVLYLDDNDILTSAGVAAGLDLCLHVVRRDHGAATAANIARHTVIAPHRDGDQAQFIQQPITPTDRGTSLLPTRGASRV
jgi:hypothetical protein